MLPEERQFPAFVAGLTHGLYRAALTDPDVFLLLVTGILLGSRTRSGRGLGSAMAMYVAFRRLDRYVDAAIQVARVGHINRQKAMHSLNTHGT